MGSEWSGWSQTVDAWSHSYGTFVFAHTLPGPQNTLSQTPGKPLLAVCHGVLVWFTAALKYIDGYITERKDYLQVHKFGGRGNKNWRAATSHFYFSTPSGNSSLKLSILLSGQKLCSWQLLECFSHKQTPLSNSDQSHNNFASREGRKVVQLMQLWQLELTAALRPDHAEPFRGAIINNWNRRKQGLNSCWLYVDQMINSVMIEALSMSKKTSINTV